MTTLSKWRINYPDTPLTRQEVYTDPFMLFQEWIIQAQQDGVIEPNAMTLSTIDEHNRPDSRMVLLKDFTAEGFVFYSNYHSAKGKQLADNNAAALCFWWPNSHRQVRVRGIIKKLSSEKSDNYFQSRDRDTKLGAWASHQSEKIDSYHTLQQQFKQVRSQFEGQEVSRPPYWGGYILTPNEFEFWQGRHSRLHDRLLFTSNQGKWGTQRLSP